MIYAPHADTERKDRLSPPLMYVFRSTDKAAAKSAGFPSRRQATNGTPQSTTSVKPQRVAITEQALQNEVVEDMSALLSHVSFDSSINISDFDLVQKSVLNYGFPDFANRSIDELERADLDGDIVQILKLFEPRLVGSTLRVTRDASIDKSQLQIRYFVRSDLMCRPLNIPVEFIADVDVASGKIHISGKKG